MNEIRDYMFGDNILPDQRVQALHKSQAGVQHGFQIEPLRPKPGQPIRLKVTTSSELPYQRVRLFYTLDGSAPDPGNCLSQDLEPGQVVWDHLGWQYLRHWHIDLPPQAEDTLIRYRVAAQVAGKQEWIYADSQVQQPDQATNFSLWITSTPAPAWVDQALIYHVFVDRFFAGAGKEWNQPQYLDGFYGGTIRGVEEKLDYIQSLGYNTLWLSPFFASPSHHGYDATDMYQVEPRLGTNQDLYHLIETIHQRGMRIILDFVANHWSHKHPSLLAAQKERNSAFYDWYIWKDWPEEYEGFFGVKTMPKLNLQLGSPARQYLLNCARFWLEKGFDGYRLDFAYGPPLDFWIDFRRVCKKTKPDCWLFGEVIHSAQAQRSFAPAFDGMIDFLLAEALRQTFGYARWRIDQFEAFLSAHETYFEGVFERLTILDNHDMNRFLFLAGNDQRRLKLGALLIYTLEGNPINYYGTEAGVTQERPTHQGERGLFEEARQPMLWGEQADQELIAYFQRLTELRHAHPALRKGNRKVLHLDAETGAYVYERQLGKGRFLVAFNLDEEPRVITLNLAEFVGAKDLLNNQKLEADGNMVSIHLSPLSGTLIGMEKDDE